MARAEVVAESIVGGGGRAVAVEADLTDADVIPSLFDTAEAQFGPVQILVNNASGWVGDSFAPGATDRFGRSVTASLPRPSTRSWASTPGQLRCSSPSSHAGTSRGAGSGAASSA